MKKKILLITLTLLFTLSCSVYAETDPVIDNTYPFATEITEDPGETVVKSIASSSITVKRSSSTKLSFSIMSRISGSPDSLRMTATLYKKSGSSYNYTGNYKSTTKSKPSGTVTYTNSFGVGSGSTYKVKVTLTEIKNGKKNIVTYWSKAA